MATVQNKQPKTLAPLLGYIHAQPAKEYTMEKLQGWMEAGKDQQQEFMAEGDKLRKQLRLGDISMETFLAETSKLNQKDTEIKNGLRILTNFTKDGKIDAGEQVRLHTAMSAHLQAQGQK